MKLQYFVYTGPVFMGMARIAASFKNVQLVIFGPRGDTYAHDLLVMRERLSYVPKIHSAQITVKELATGALPVLLDTILRILRESPDDIILICPTVTSVLLKEDPAMILARLGSEQKKRVYFPPVHFFKDNENTAADKTLHFLLERFSVPLPRSENPSVNILGISLFGYNYLHNLNALKLLLMDLGVDINLVLPLGTSVFDLRTAARAWANIPCDHAISCTTGSFLRDAYHQPSLSHMPYGVYNTGRFIEELGALTGKDFSAYIASKEKETVGKWKEYLVSRDLSKLRVCIFGDYTASLGLAQTMKKDFHSQILMAGTYDTVHKDLFTEQAREVSGTVLVTDDSREVWENIRQLDPHLVMGTLNEERLCSIHKIPFIGISMPSRYIQTSLYPVETFLGYSGFDHLLGSIRRLFPK